MVSRNECRTVRKDVSLSQEKANSDRSALPIHLVPDVGGVSPEFYQSNFCFNVQRAKLLMPEAHRTVGYFAPFKGFRSLNPAP